MKKVRRFPVPLAAAALVVAAGCSSGSSSSYRVQGVSQTKPNVQSASVSDPSSLKGQQLAEVYFRPFDLSEVKLEGDHGDAVKTEENKKKWFSHVVAGAQRQLTIRTSAIVVKDATDDYDKIVMEKSKVKFSASPTPPPDAIVVTGKYLSSRNVAGVARAFLGMMSGKSWNRAEVTIRRGDATLFQGTLDGKFLGGGYSWGYETLIVNEGLGAGIAGVIQKLQRGEPVEAKK